MQKIFNTALHSVGNNFWKMYFEVYDINSAVRRVGQLNIYFELKVNRMTAQSCKPYILKTINNATVIYADFLIICITARIF